MPKAKTDKIVFYGTGRRKSSIARVRLVEGKGTIVKSPLRKLWIW